jgi:hypothetical protein
MTSRRVGSGRVGEDLPGGASVRIKQLAPCQSMIVPSRHSPRSGPCDTAPSAGDHRNPTLKIEIHKTVVS